MMNFVDLKLAMTRERPVSCVPRTIIILLIASLFTQIAWHAARPPPVTRIATLPLPPRTEFLDVISFGEPCVLSRLLMLWLQAFDNQPGISVPFKQLDYDRVIAWLNTILELDPLSQYPLLSAARLYSEVPDDTKKRKMLSFIYNKFLEDPDNRWQWMAHAVYVAKHRMGDMELALVYARALRMNATGTNVPGWAKQMELFVLEDMGEVEQAKILLGGLLADGIIRDENELRFLMQRLSMEESGN